MNKEAKILIGLGVATLLVLIGGVFFFTNRQKPTEQEVKRYDAAILAGRDPFVKGSPEAPITIVEFGDFQCPACGASYPITKALMAQYSDKVKLVFRQFPLEMHAHAFDAARASEAAGAQGKFWEMHDKLYENQDKWAQKDDALIIFEGYASELGLNTDQYKKDMASKAFDARIQAGLTDGTATGVNATPTFFVNGQKMAGVFTLDEWKRLIDSLLSTPSTK